MWLFRRFRRNKILRENPLADTAWREVLADHPILAGLAEEEEGRLRELAVLFLHEKIYEPVQGLGLTEPMRLVIAVQCCLPVMNLGQDWLDGWRTVIAYPGAFVRKREQFDSSGVMHEWEEAVSGEAWKLGPLILSWADVEASGWGDGYNVAIHEIAHKLDLLNGEVDGFPPLHRGMSAKAWNQAFSAAFDDFNRRLDAGAATEIDPYAAEAPGEFFAVLSEYFFELPGLVFAEYPEVYRQLAAFYRQDPLARMERVRVANPPAEG
ncbi:MtfA peptidase [Myxococcaceae bacterium]|nr:MtfA peptidase [Myxococcaceae bacterium]